MMIHVMPTGRDRDLFPRRDEALPTLIDIETVSRSLGISMRQVRRFIAEGTMPFVRVGHLIRFDPDELNDWIDARRSGSLIRDDHSRNERQPSATESR
jgi:excisionase family DNA binding protein